MRPGSLRPLLVALVVLGTACSIKTRVDPVPAATVPALCVEENDAVWSKQFLPMLRERLAQHGIATTVYKDRMTADCRYHLEYEAQWNWDLAVYLRYADIRVFDGDTLVGRATYDARSGSGRLDKFGHTDEKLAPLLDALLASVNRSGATTDR
jgi:hypothetical protein